MGAIDRVFRSRRPSQERPLAAIIAGLWRNGEQGVWYEAGDLATMFQDAAGTLPVYAPGQGQVDPPVGRILDKSGRGNHAAQATTTSRPTLSARYNLLIGTDALATQSVNVVAASYTLCFAGTGSVTLSGAAAGTYSAGSRSITCTAGLLTLTVSGGVNQADLRPANDGVGLPPYQRVVDANTYDTVGFPLYLRFDGVDDFLQTASVDFSGTDKIFLCAALRKLSDAASGIVAELSQNSSSVDGAFMLAAPSANGVNKFRFVSKGTILADAATTSAAYTAPFSGIVACRGSISGRTAEMRINGAVAATSALDQGAGNFSSAQLFIGRRGADGTLSFNGRLYSLLIRGAATADPTLIKVERHLNQKARIY